MNKNFFIAIALSALLSSCHVGRFFIWNFADTRDYKKFPSVEIHKSTQPFSFHQTRGSSSQLRLPNELSIGEKNYSFEEALEAEKTVAFLIIQNDTILYERYFKKYDEGTIHPSFSMAKSFVGTLAGIAIDEGHIKSIKDPITNYLSILPNKEFAHITVEHVLNMETGIKFDEGYFNPLGDVAKFYYGKNLNKYLTKLEIEQKSGQNFNYISLNTQLLAKIIEKATNMPIQGYLQTKLWEPLGMEYDATWSVDSKKHQMVKAFCCLNARTHDFAKLGKLFLDKGKFNGKQVLSKEWVIATTQTNGSYQNQWWQKKQAYYAHGILGQFIYVDPSKKLIMVRLGKNYGNIGWTRLFAQIADMN